MGTDDKSKQDSFTHSHPVIHRCGKALQTAADMAVDIAAIIAIALMAVEQVDLATIQITGGMVTTIAIGKRYYESKQRTS